MQARVELVHVSLVEHPGRLVPEREGVAKGEVLRGTVLPVVRAGRRGQYSDRNDRGGDDTGDSAQHGVEPTPINATPGSPERSSTRRVGHRRGMAAPDGSATGAGWRRPTGRPPARDGGARRAGQAQDGGGWAGAPLRGACGGWD